MRSHASRSTPSSRSSPRRPNHQSSRSWDHATHWDQRRTLDGAPRAVRSSSTNVLSDSAAATSDGPRSTASAIASGRRASQSASRTMPARRPMRSQRTLGSGRPPASRAGTSPRSAISALRRRPRRSSSSRSASSRGTILSSVPVPGRPFQGMPAAVSWCSTMRAYGRRVGQSTAMRSKRVPRRAPSTTARTASRTSSSASVVEITSTSPDRGAGTLAQAAPPVRSVASAWIGSSASGWAVIPTISSTSAVAASARRNCCSSGRSRSGRYTTTRASRSGRSRRVAEAAAASRSPSSYHDGASRRATSAATRAGSLPRAVRASAVSAVGPATRSSDRGHEAPRPSTDGGAPARTAQASG